MYRFDDYLADPDLLLATAAEMYDAVGRDDLAELIRNADLVLGETSYDNWNGGTTFYAASVIVPVHLFPTSNKEVDSIESSILKKLQVCTKHCANQQISVVNLQPKIVKAKAWRRKGKPLTTSRTEELTTKIWGDSHFRLFLSHSSVNKRPLADVKHYLEIYGVSAFLAHEDINPSEEWLNSIQVALMSCNALAAFITDEFRDSLWTDQEVGIAYGQNIFVLPVKVGRDPYGFIGKTQAVNAWWEHPRAMAKDIVSAFISHPETSTAMKAAVVQAIEQASSYDRARSVCNLAMSSQGFTKDQYAKMFRASSINSQVRDAGFGSLGTQLKNWAVKNDPTLADTPTHDVDDYDPFAEE